MQARTIDAVRGGVQIRLADSSPIPPETVVRIANSRPNVRVVPPGMIRLDVPAEASDLERITEVRALLLDLGARDRLAASPARP